MRSHLSRLIGVVAAALSATLALAQEAAFAPKAAASSTRKASRECRRADDPAQSGHAYSEARFAQFYKGKKFMPAWQIPKIEADPEYASYTRTTTSDSNGRFTFENVAPGKYYVATQIMWRPKGNIFSEGGALYDIVTVPNKDTKKVKFILTGP